MAHLNCRYRIVTCGVAEAPQKPLRLSVLGMLESAYGSSILEHMLFVTPAQPC